MLYFANPSTQPIRDAMQDQPKLGFIATPDSSRPCQRVDGAQWCADNGCFGKKDFDEARWWRWLTAQVKHLNTCLFATAPDVVGNHVATIERSEQWLPKIRELGFPAAFVAQDGAEPDTIPWSTFDVLFVGGTTAWKLGQQARRVISHAKSIGMWVHFGRVNSARRYRYADHLGCDSADGTFLIFGPDKNLPKLIANCTK